MDLDLNKFRTLIPIQALYEESLAYLVGSTQVRRYSQGEIAFDIDDEDNEAIFLMSGELMQTSAENEEILISAGMDKALYALANRKPRRYRGVVTSETAVIARVEARLLGKLLAWGEFAEPEQVTSISLGPDVKESSWMMSMLQTSAFLKLPSANLQTLFQRMEEVNAMAGDVIVNMGEPGNYYYIIKEGKCHVTKPSGDGVKILAELDSCDSFGEEALISDAPRNATVSMLTDGVLMRLSKEDFQELLEEPLLKWVDSEQAMNLAQNGAVRVDVRLESEFDNTHVPGAINIPLHQLRQHITDLDKSLEYIFYCDTGQCSSAAAFLMSQRGFDAYVMKGGISASG